MRVFHEAVLDLWRRKDDAECCFLYVPRGCLNYLMSVPTIPNSLGSQHLDGYLG